MSRASPATTRGGLAGKRTDLVKDFPELVWGRARAELALLLVALKTALGRRVVITPRRARAHADNMPGWRR
ncbi:MAG: hypothetical protein ACPIOQ_51450 [Promethearchaeia archaeon]